jgi:hypothetical protein
LPLQDILIDGKFIELFPGRIDQFPGHPLIYDNESSRFPPDTLLSVIVKNMMVEQWNSSSSFDRYYEGCAPIYCTYSYTTRTFDFIEIVIKVVSTISGLTMVLRLITPQLIKVTFWLRRPRIKRQRQGN